MGEEKSKIITQIIDTFNQLILLSLHRIVITSANMQDEKQVQIGTIHRLRLQFSQIFLPPKSFSFYTKKFAIFQDF